MYEANGEKYFVMDGHIHFWDASPANWVQGQEKYAKGWIECFHAYQENRNLLLSKQAHADSIPGLEILANDVRCTHGATLGQVDREQIGRASCRERVCLGV